MKKPLGILLAVIIGLGLIAPPPAAAAGAQTRSYVGGGLVSFDPVEGSEPVTVRITVTDQHSPRTTGFVVCTGPVEGCQVVFALGFNEDWGWCPTSRSHQLVVRPDEAIHVLVYPVRPCARTTYNPLWPVVVNPQLATTGVVTLEVAEP